MFPIQCILLLRLCPKDAKPVAHLHFAWNSELLTAVRVLSVFATPWNVSESNAKVGCFVLLFIQLAYYHENAEVLIWWCEQETCTAWFSPVIHTSSRLWNGLEWPFVAFHMCMWCTSTARERYNLTPFMGWIHETVTAESCRLFGRQIHTLSFGRGSTYNQK